MLPVRSLIRSRRAQTTTDYDDFISALSDSSIDPDRDKMTTVFDDATFMSAGQDARFYGETHSPETSVHVFSSFIELDSDDAATSALDWLETDQMKPCPMSCAVQRSSFEVDDIPDARGVHRVATTQEHRKGRNARRDATRRLLDRLRQSVPIVYTVVLHGHAVPGTVSEDQARRIASAYYNRLTS